MSTDSESGSSNVFRFPVENLSCKRNYGECKGKIRVDWSRSEVDISPPNVTPRVQRCVSGVCDSCGKNSWFYRTVPAEEAELIILEQECEQVSMPDENGALMM
ncbi:hypothetical protein KKC32_03210 [Patescibacteria group bacterium]|nr:hypothetical protein [Patescibacteria group bacterium]